MKPKISFLTMFLSLSIFIIIFSSCAKEEIHPITDTKKAISPKAIDDSEEVFDYVADTVPVFSSELSSLDEVLENIKFEEHAEWGIAIKAFNCRGRGETLIVYNPKSDDIEFYDSKRFRVLWFKNNRPLARETKFRLGCVCKGIYAAIVLNRRTQTAVGIAFQPVGRCHYEIEEATTNKTR